MRRHRRIERAQDARTHLGREPPVQHHGAVVVVPEGQAAVLVLGIGPLGLLGALRAAMEADKLLHMLRGAVQSDVEEVGFVLRSGDAGQRPNLGVAELALGQRRGEQRQLRQRPGDADLLPRGMGIDAAGPGEPVGARQRPLPELDAVLIARREVAGRRNFDLAHELFHILTWDAMPPEHVEYASDFGGNRVEQLANNFAAAVLMPTTALASYDGWAQLDMEGLIAQLNHVADELCVTSSALRWRLVALRRLTKSKARAIPEAALRNNGRTTHAEEPPALFSRPFAGVLAAAVDRGHLSVRRAAALVGLPIEGLEELFAVHRVEYLVDI